MNERLEWMDVARGLGIILVVFGHVLRGLMAAGIVPPTSPWLISDYVVYTFHMPLFFFLAGMNVENSLRRGAWAFIKSKLWTIAYAYLVWSLIQGSIQVGMSGSTNHPITAHDILSIPWKPISPFWFLYSLMLCHLIAAAVAPRFRLLLGVAIVGYATSFFLGDNILAISLHFVLFYAFGVIFRSQVIRWVASGHNLPLSFVAIWSLFTIAATIAYRTGYSYESPLALAATLLGIAGMIWTARMFTGTPLRVAQSLGIMSMSIYVMHILADAGTRILLTKLGFSADIALNLVACTAAGVLLPALAHLTFQRLGLLVPLGLAPLKSRIVTTPSR